MRKIINDPRYGLVRGGRGREGEEKQCGTFQGLHTLHKLQKLSFGVYFSQLICIGVPEASFSETFAVYGNLYVPGMIL